MDFSSRAMSSPIAISIKCKRAFACFAAVFTALPFTTLLAGNIAAAESAPITATSTTAIPTAARKIHYRSIDIDGIKIFYREAGDPKYPTILLLHGFSSSSHMFRDLMPLLSDRFHLIAPDYPGFGYSDAPPGNLFEPTFAHLETVIEKFVAAVELKSFAVYMQDFGGPVGFRMAVKHPEWISGLIIQNANAYREGIAPEQLQGMDKLIESRAAGNNTPSQKTSARVVTPEFITYLYRHGARDASSLNPDAWTVDIAALQNSEAKRIQADLIDNYYTNLQQYPEWQAYLRKWQPKTLIVWGKNDRGFLPLAAESYRRDLPKLELQYFDTGHFALEENAAEIAQAIAQFFRPE